MERNITDTPITLIHDLLEELPLGVVLLDADGRITLFNRYEERLARRKREAVLGRDFFEEVAPCMNVQQLAGEFRSKIGHEPLNTDVQFSFPFPFLEEPREVVVRMRSLWSDGAPYGCLYIEDVSHRMAIERMREALGEFLVHDMKNPLAATLANVQFALTQPELSDDGREALEDAALSAQRLERMVHGLLEYTRLQTSQMPLDRRAVDLGHIARETVESFQALARLEGKGVEARVESEAKAWVDPQVVRRALDNLVDNGLRHSPPSGTVTVTCAREAETVRLAVADEGAGVPDELGERIFEPYVRAEHGTARRANQGLGLSFVRLAALAHGGSAHVGRADTGGSVFTLRVPALGAEPAAASDPPVGS